MIIDINKKKSTELSSVVASNVFFITDSNYLDKDSPYLTFNDSKEVIIPLTKGSRAVINLHTWNMAILPAHTKVTVVNTRLTNI